MDHFKLSVILLTKLTAHHSTAYVMQTGKRIERKGWGIHRRLLFCRVGADRDLVEMIITAALQKHALLICLSVYCCLFIMQWQSHTTCKLLYEMPAWQSIRKYFLTTSDMYISIYIYIYTVYSLMYTYAWDNINQHYSTFVLWYMQCLQI